MRKDRTVKEIFLAPSGQQIAFEDNGDTVSFSLPPFALHNLIIIK